MAESLVHALRSLWLHRLRTGLSALGVVGGVMAFVAILGLGEGARRETLAQIEQLGMRNVVVRAAVLSSAQEQVARGAGSAGLTLDDAERLRAAVPGILRIAALREVRAAVIEPGRPMAAQVLSVTPDYLQVHALGVASGRTLADDDHRRRARVCVLGHGVSRRLGGTGQVGASLRIDGGLCRVVGVLRRFDRRANGSGPVAVRDYDNAIAMPLGAEGEDAAAPRLVSELVVELSSGDAVMAALPALRRSLQVAHHGIEDYRIVAPQELVRQAERSRRNFDILAASLAALCLAIGGLGIMNTMLASVTERTREIGIRRAVGATRGHIAAQFLTEAAVLTAAGAAAGLLLGVAAVAAISVLAGWPVAITPWTLVVPTVAALAAGLFFGIHPAVRAARMDPIAALRHE
ncbi:MAG TPA: ABC transporter permease [Usitatibacter sp.]|nr:ABC transporter permease [Usitatibacter sp.]